MQRKESLEGMGSLVNRVTDPRISARFLIMQRLHTDDATNYALENWPNVEHICYPMRFNEQIAHMQPTDHREYEGQLLWPTVWTEEAVAAEERELTSYGVAGQLQQSPVPRGGGIILREWWRLWPEDAPEAAGMDSGYRCPVCKWTGYVRAAEATASPVRRAARLRLARCRSRRSRSGCCRSIRTSARRRRTAGPPRRAGSCGMARTMLRG